MKTFSQDLTAHLAGGVTTLCWCWKLTRRDGLILGFTDHDRDLIMDGVSYEAGSGLTGSDLETTSGLAAGNSEAEGALISGRIDEDGIRLGLFDGAAIEIWLVNWQAPDQRALMQAGTLGEITRSAHGFRAELRGRLAALEEVKGRLFQPSCDAVLGDARCGADITSKNLTATVTLTGAQGPRLTVTGLDGVADDWFAEGRLIWSTGANAGVSQRIRSQRAGGLVILWESPPAAWLAGDTARLIAGCDKRFSTCRSKFANARNFRGFPHMPGNDFLTSPV